MTILVDMDGTINLFDTYLIFTLKKYGIEFNMLEFKQQNDWNIENYIISENPKETFYSIMEDISFWRSIPVAPQAVRVLSLLNRHHDVKIVTVPWGSNQKMKDVKLQWLQQYFPFLNRNQVIFHDQKWEIPGEAIIDDKPSIIEKCFGKKITIVPEHPYNTRIKCNFRFKYWAQVPDIFRVIFSEGAE